MTRLFVDDTRSFPSSGYECCRDATSAKLLLSIMKFDFITLDYTLGKDEETGLDILIWMKNNNIFAPKINIHSNHVFGKEKMYNFCKENFPNSKITTNTLPK